MRIVTDRAATWRLEVECSGCNSVLEVLAADVGIRKATEHEEDAVYDLVQTDGTTGSDFLFVTACAACKDELVLEPDVLPPFVVKAARERVR